MRSVRIISKKPAIDVSHDMGDGDARITSGLGGWTTVPRDDDVAVTDWIGQDPLRQDIPLLLDGFRTNRTVDLQLETLMRLGRDPQGDPPPVFRVFGPIHFEGRHWVVDGDQGITLEDGAIRRAGDGQLVRQPVTLHLLEYVRPETIRIRRRKKIGVGPAVAIQGLGQNVVASRRYTTKVGDTLAKIAAYLYGDWRRWREIGDLNKIRDPNRVLPRGTVLKL